LEHTRFTDLKLQNQNKKKRTNNLKQITMNVITSNPILVNRSAPAPSEEFYNADDAKTLAGKRMKKGYSNTDPSGKKRKGHVWDKTKGIWVKAQDSGLLSSIGQFLNPGANVATDPMVTTDTYVDPNAKQPMSTTTKVLIGVAVAGAIALVVYAVSSKKSAK